MHDGPLIVDEVGGTSSYPEAGLGPTGGGTHSPTAQRPGVVLAIASSSWSSSFTEHSHHAADQPGSRNYDQRVSGRPTLRASRMQLPCAAFGLVLLAPLAACSNAADSADTARSCQEIETVGYPEMEAAARLVLNGVRYRLERIGACADTGEPRTVLYAYVDDWPNRQVANRYFKQHRWTETNGMMLTSPGGQYSVNNITSVEADSTTSFVTVQFFELADHE